MQVIDLTPEYLELYLCCLEDWSDEMKDAGDHKFTWYNTMKNRGLRVKLALDEHGEVGGMIQYLPIEESFVEGKDLFFIYCIWVHGYKKGRGNFQKAGMGKALLSAAEQDVQYRGAKGIAAWGLLLPFWMKASWFKKNGYIKVDRLGMRVLLWKPFVNDAIAPKIIRQKNKPKKQNGVVTISAFIDGWCPGQNINFERAKRAAAEFEESVIFHKIDTLNRTTFLKWGISDALFIDDKEISTGPPLSYEKMKKLIAKRVDKLNRKKFIPRLLSLKNMFS